MSEDISVMVHIGGDLAEEDVEGLIAAIDECVFESCVSENEVRACSKKSISLSLSGTANYGNIDDLKAFCENHDLSYIDHCEAKYEFDASLSFWLPGMKGEQVLPANQGGDINVSAVDVRPLCDLLLDLATMGEKALPLHTNNDQVKDIVEKALKNPKRLKKLLQDKINGLMPVKPTLPPLRII
jgi:hypothetical protein